MVQNSKRAKKDRDQKVISADDIEISKFIESSKTKIFVVGVGGSGSNTMTRISELHINGATLIAMNTDAKHLAGTKAHRKVLLGRLRTRGLGAGSDPSVGAEAAMESVEEVRHIIGGGELVFVTCGLGGGTGTGGAPIILAEAKAAGALTVAVVTLPFTSEGKTRMKNALAGLVRLKENVDTAIVIPNDKLLALAADMPLDKAFRKIDDILANATKGIIEMVTKSGMVNLDFADLKNALKDSGYAVISTGESRAAKLDARMKNAIESTLKNPLLDIDMSKTKKALVSITGSSDLTLKEAERVFREISGRISDDASMKWGARIEPKLRKGTLKVMVVMSGVALAAYVEDSIRQSDQEQSLDIQELGLEDIDYIG